MEKNKEIAIKIVKSHMKDHNFKSLNITNDDDITGARFWKYDGDVPMKEYYESKEYQYAYTKGYVMALISNFNLTNEDLE